MSVHLQCTRKTFTILSHIQCYYANSNLDMNIDLLILLYYCYQVIVTKKVAGERGLKYLGVETNTLSFIRILLIYMCSTKRYKYIFCEFYGSNENIALYNNIATKSKLYIYVIRYICKQSVPK